MRLLLGVERKVLWTLSLNYCLVLREDLRVEGVNILQGPRRVEIPYERHIQDSFAC